MTPEELFKLRLNLGSVLGVVIFDLPSVMFEVVFGELGWRNW